jgi:prephenate dehydrogenase
MSPHLIQRVTILGTGLIGGSFALALRKYAPDLYIAGWDRADVVQQAQKSGALNEAFSDSLEPALRAADLIYIALPIGATLDLLPEIARHAASHALVTDASSTKQRITQAAAELFPQEGGPYFLGGHPMAGRELSGFEHADADLFRNATYALTSDSGESRDPRVAAFVKILGKMGARPVWLGAKQHDYAVGLASHLPQLAAVAWTRTACPSRWRGRACAIRCVLRGARTALGAISCSPIAKCSLWRSISSPAASMISANASAPANSKPISTPPTNSTNFSAACSRSRPVSSR